jgi:hypothetical protein
MQTLYRGKAIISNKSVRSKLLGLVGEMGKIVYLLQTMPKKYDEKKVIDWAKKYDNAF